MAHLHGKDTIAGIIAYLISNLHHHRQFRESLSFLITVGTSIPSTSVKGRKFAHDLSYIEPSSTLAHSLLTRYLLVPSSPARAYLVAEVAGSDHASALSGEMAQVGSGQSLIRGKPLSVSVTLWHDSSRSRGLRTSRQGLKSTRSHPCGIAGSKS